MLFSNVKSLQPAQTFTQAIVGMLRVQKLRDMAILAVAFLASHNELNM